MPKQTNDNYNPWAGVALIGVITAVLWGGYFIASKWMEKDLFVKQAAYESRLLEAEEALAQVEKQEAQMQAEASDSDAARIERDDSIIENLFSETLTWADFEGYTAAREGAMEHYGVPENSRFLEVFLPEVHETPETQNGTVYNYIDVNGINIHYEGKETHLCEIDGDVYRYFAEVTISSLDRNGNEGMMTSAVLYSVDGEGKVTGLDAYTLVD